MVTFGNIGDLHLYDKEIGATINYPEESTRNVKKVRSYFLDNDLDFLILGGDIQHGKPDDIKYMSTWRTELRKIRDDVYARMKEKDLFKDLKVYDYEGEEMDIESGEHSCLFSLKGNHDYNRRESREKSFTFFDDLVDDGVISVPQKIIWKGVQVNCYSSKECMYPVAKEEGIETVIGIYHDPIIQDGRLNDTYMGKMISPDEHKFFNGVDLAILNDIHLPIDPYKVVTVDGEGVGHTTEVLTQGSIGRTSFNNSHKRDIAYQAEIQMDENGDVEYNLGEIELLPYKQLFDYQKAIKVKNQSRMNDIFSLEVEKVDVVKKDPRDEIREMDVEKYTDNDFGQEDVRDLCIGMLDEVMEDLSFELPDVRELAKQELEKEKEE